MNKDIVAIGGGGFGRSIGDLKIEKYITSLSNVKKPNICFIPTASGDDDTYIVSFYNAFTKILCNPTHVDFFKRTIDLREHIYQQDIIYVGGGNTKSMLGVWKEWGLVEILREAYNSGVIMSGVSAGAICWFSYGISDSWKNNLSIIPCMGFVEGTCCPHYDEEKNRIPYVEKMLIKGTLDNCIAIEGNCALHFKDGKPYRSLDFGENKKSYNLYYDQKRLISKPYKSKTI